MHAMSTSLSAYSPRCRSGQERDECDQGAITEFIIAKVFNASTSANKIFSDAQLLVMQRSL